MSNKIKIWILGPKGDRRDKIEEILSLSMRVFCFDILDLPQITNKSEAPDVLVILASQGEQGQGFLGALPRIYISTLDPLWSPDLHERVRKEFCKSMPESDCCCEVDPYKLPGCSDQWTSLLNSVELIKNHPSPLLVLGETGVGKDVLARRIHDSSLRRDGPFIALNCGSIPLTLVESELMGCEKGAFTDAVSRPGVFELARGGTLFLDEVGELPLAAQVKLLRILEEKKLRRIGGKTTIDLDFRLISATNRSLSEEVEKGQFRADLYYRLNVFTLKIPPLRERVKDILHLSRIFLEGLQSTSCSLYPEASKKLINHVWPGNIRELRNVIERAGILSGGGIITHEHVCFDSLL